MAEIIQLAKDTLKGGTKTEIYPKTLAAAIEATDIEGKSVTLDALLQELLEYKDKNVSLYYGSNIVSGETTMPAGTVDKIRSAVNYGIPAKITVGKFVGSTRLVTTYYFLTDLMHYPNGPETMVFYNPNADPKYIIADYTGTLTTSNTLSQFEEADAGASATNTGTANP